MADLADNYENKKLPAWLRFLPPDPDGFTYKEYETWDDDIRVELIDGMVYMMSSSDEWHQWVSMEILRQLGNQLQGKKCTPYSEFDVRLFYQEDKSDKTVVRPDIIVVCDESKVMGKKNCEGAPDFVIEILSEYSRGRDYIDKKNKYEQAGVKEYWIVSRYKLHIFNLIEGIFNETEKTIHRELNQPVSCLENCFIDFQGMVDRYQSGA